MVNKLFTGIISVTIQVYMDDVLVKSVRVFDHTDDLMRTFERISLHQVCQNPTKCAFGVQSSKFLGNMVNQKGIEVNLKKHDAIEGMNLSQGGETPKR